MQPFGFAAGFVVCVSLWKTKQVRIYHYRYSDACHINKRTYFIVTPQKGLLVSSQIFSKK